MALIRSTGLRNTGIKLFWFGRGGVEAQFPNPCQLTSSRTTEEPKGFVDFSLLLFSGFKTYRTKSYFIINYEENTEPTYS